MPSGPPEEVTRQEMWAMLAEAGIKVEAFAERRAYLDFAEVMLRRVNKFSRDHYTALSGQLSPVAKKAAKEMYLNEARARAKTFAQDMIGTELRAMGETIAAGLEAGLGPKEIARRLDMVKNLDARSAKAVTNYAEKLKKQGLGQDEIDKKVAKYRAKKLRERKERIARTEAAHATGIARESEAVARGAKFKTWISVGDRRVSQACIVNEMSGDIPIKDAFASGAEREPQHPSCRCSVSYFTDSKVAGRAGERAKERGKATQAAVDRGKADDIAAREKAETEKKAA